MQYVIDRDCDKKVSQIGILGVRLSASGQSV